MSCGCTGPAEAAPKTKEQNAELCTGTYAYKPAYTQLIVARNLPCIAVGPLAKWRLRWKILNSRRVRANSLMPLLGGGVYVRFSHPYSDYVTVAELTPLPAEVPAPSPSTADVAAAEKAKTAQLSKYFAESFRSVTAADVNADLMEAQKKQADLNAKQQSMNAAQNEINAMLERAITDVEGELAKLRKRLNDAGLYRLKVSGS